MKKLQLSETDQQIRRDMVNTIIKNHQHPDLPEVIVDAMHLAAQNTPDLQKAREQAQAIADAVPIPPLINITTAMEVDAN